MEKLQEYVLYSTMVQLQREIAYVMEFDFSSWYDWDLTNLSVSFKFLFTKKEYLGN